MKVSLLTTVIAKTNMNELSGFKAPFQGFNTDPHWDAHIGKPYNSSSANLIKEESFSTVHGVTNGWSALGGQTSSAYVFGGFKTGGDPLGSSSGNGVGLSAGWGAFALGLDTMGSDVSGFVYIGKCPDIGFVISCALVLMLSAWACRKSCPLWYQANAWSATKLRHNPSVVSLTLESPIQ